MRASSTLFLKGQTPFCTTLFGSSKFYKGILHVKKHPIILFCNNIQTNSYEVANGSYIPTLQNEDKNNKENPSRKLEAIGAFQKLPMVMPSVDIIGSALRKELAGPLRTYVENFPKETYLHPYERSLVELTLGDGYYETVYKENCSATIRTFVGLPLPL